MNNMPPNVAAYLLMLPDMCDAYRRLQSGKRHARFDPKEFLNLKTIIPDEAKWKSMDEEIERRRKEIIDMRHDERETRKKIDDLFGVS